MAVDISNHPCFNDKIRHTFGRVHLPVAPRCNIQCNYCNRKYDCVNESRPGVTSALLSPRQALYYLEYVMKSLPRRQQGAGNPRQALYYLEYVMKKSPNISVVGIAGPGDPFANARETMETLELVREKYPEIILCLATNGLNIGPYIEGLAELNVSHVTITINALDAEIGARIYAWVRFGKRVYNPNEGFKILLDNQIKAVRYLKKKGISVKVNTIIIPGINDCHIEAVAEKMSELRVDIHNCIGYYRNKGTVFENIKEPSPELVQKIRKKAGEHLTQMYHCVRCRADAVGLLGKDDAECFKTLKECSNEKTQIPSFCV